MKPFYIALLLILSSCALTADQESSLDQAVREYVDARNKGDLESYVHLTHPNAVAYYKEIGDKDFVKKFDLNRSEDHYKLYDGRLKSVVKRKGEIQAQYEFYAEIEEGFDISRTRKTIYVVSVDEGKNWYFLEADDYKNDHIIDVKQRFFE